MILVLSAPHQRFTLPELRRLDEALPQVRERLASARPVAGYVVLATCHRVEVYLDADDADDVEPLVRAAFVAGGGPGLGARLIVRTDADAARHLIEVASGLASMVVGENGIAGQVKAAMGAAHDAGTMTPALYRAFRLATRTAKAVASTDLGRQGRSLVGAAIEGINVGRAVVIGTGSFARVAVTQLQRAGCERIAVYSPSGRAEAFAATRPVVPVAARGLVDELACADVVLGCSGQSEPTLTVDLVTRALARRNAELRIIDLALRPDVVGEVGTLPGVRLSDLASVRADAGVDDTQARLLVDEAVADYLNAEREREATSALRVLRESVRTVADAEMERALRHLGDLTPAQADQVRLLVHRVAQGVLHGPSVRARQLARDGRLDELERATDLLFG